MRARLVGALLLAASVAHAEPRRLTVEDAVQLAVANNPRLRSVDVRAQAVRDRALSVRGRMLPAVRLSEEYQHYDSPFTFQFAPMTQVFSLRNQDTNTFVASADQPLLGLLHLSEDYLAERSNADAGRAQYRVATSQVSASVRTRFLQYFEAKALEEIARTSVAELADQVAIAQARLKAGVITNADLLRVQVAQANARQQEIAAASQADVVRAGLLGTVGFSPDDTGIVLEEPANLLTAAAAPLPPVKDAQSTAERSRPELVQERLLAKAADHERRARGYLLLPEINAEAAYLRVDGQVFAPPNSAYVGVKAQWAIWEWGATWYAQRAASKLAEAAHLDVDAARVQIATEVHAGLSQSNAAASAVDLARTTIASAEEAYRVTDALVKAGSATTTDLLDAQSALTGARLNLARARYEQAIARVSLSRTLGQ